MELSAYFRIIRRWLWLIALAAIIAGSAAYISARTEAPVFRASATIQLGNYLNLTDPNPGMITSAAALAETYMTLLKTSPILQSVVDNLKLPFSPGALAGMFSGRITQGTSFLTLTVVYTDPVIAAEVANELTRQLIENSPTDLTSEQQEQLRILQTEIRAAQAQLTQARDEMNAIDSALQSGTASEEDIAVLTARRAELVKEISETQSNLASMSSTVVQLQQRGTINYIRVIDPARIPTSPSNTNPISNTLVAAAIGAVLAFGVALVIEYLNDSLRSPAEIMPLLNLPVLGSVAPFGNKRSYKNKLITWTQPRSTIAEAYRAIRVNVLYRENVESGQCRVLVVTSAGPSEGKSVTTANLAVTFALTGMRVLFIDADMRRPSGHQIFNLPNNMGLSSVWRKKETSDPRAVVAAGSAVGSATGRTAAYEAPENYLANTIKLYLSEIVQKTEIPGLSVITAGPTPANPAELLDTPQMRELLHQVSETNLYDVVLVDTPPVLVVTDSSVVASVANAKVIVVIESGRTRRGAAVRTAQQLEALGVPVLGIIMNRLKAHDRDAGYGYYYYYGYTQYGQNRPPQLGAGSGSNGQNGQTGQMN
ncbi:MAG: AAA family ATPase [Anaerolinea sp.]|nr:AAA family ATPase [Anaerolinea sp.]MCC6973780.1 AAA family ATPase [Anaerolineae bacterium]CAG1005156.1 tyrosine-protein kinase Etk/Wzc [Anaerolineae bacterium]